MKRNPLVYIVFLVCSLLLTFSPNAQADLVTAYTFELETVDVAEALGGNGTTADDLTCVGTCNFVPGVFGQAVELVGLTDYLRTVNSSADLDPRSNGFTVAFFTQGTAFGSVGGHIVTKYWPASGWGVVCNDGVPYVEGEFSASGTHSRVRASDSTVEGDWYHVALTYDGGNIGKLYINGVLMATANDIVFNSDTVAMFIGSPSHSPGQADHGYAGFIDDFAIFNEVLTDDDILLLSDKGLEAYMGYPPPDIHGCIKLKGEPVVDAKVVFRQWRERPQSTRTDPDGCYEFETAASGKKFWITIRGPKVTR